MLNIEVNNDQLESSIVEKARLSGKSTNEFIIDLLLTVVPALKYEGFNEISDVEGGMVSEPAMVYGKPDGVASAGNSAGYLNLANENAWSTVLLKINNDKAYRLLEDLEDLNIIKVLEKIVRSQQKLSEKYAGKLPVVVADQLQQYIIQSRDEWNNRNI